MFKTNTQAEQTTKEARPNYAGDFTVSRVRVLNDKVVKFNLNLCNDTISLYECSLIAYTDKVTNEEKMFFSLPSSKGINNKYYPTSYARLSDEMKYAIIKQVLEEVYKTNS